MRRRAAAPQRHWAADDQVRKGVRDYYNIYRGAPTSIKFKSQAVLGILQRRTINLTSLTGRPADLSR